jgi:hypothetical protein
MTTGRATRTPDMPAYAKMAAADGSGQVARGELALTQSHSRHATGRFSVSACWQQAGVHARVRHLAAVQRDRDRRPLRELPCQLGAHRRNQACWSHLLRDIQDAAETYAGAIWPMQAQRATASLTQALRLFLDLDERHGEAGASINLGELLFLSLAYREARSFHQGARHRPRHRHTSRGSAGTRGNRAMPRPGRKPLPSRRRPTTGPRDLPAHRRPRGPARRNDRPHLALWPPTALGEPAVIAFGQASPAARDLPCPQ